MVYLPIGSIEWHGEHLPLGVDTLTACGFLSQTARRTGGVVLPPLFTSCSLLNLPFSLNFSATVLAGMLRETLEAARRAGDRKSVV